jgi:predicted alpha/beta hydrolase family esterase
LPISSLARACGPRQILLVVWKNALRAFFHTTNKIPCAAPPHERTLDPRKLPHHVREKREFTRETEGMFIMTKHILLIQGAGAGAYEVDKQLATSLSHSLDPQYEVHYLAFPHEDDASYEEWQHHLEKELTTMQGPIIVAGHSVGASTLIKWMSEMGAEKPIAGMFLLACPFWGGNGWRYSGYEKLMLSEEGVTNLSKGRQIFLYHCRDDAIVPFDHLALYAQILPEATVCERDECGHQFNNDLSFVAEDIKSLH